MTIAWGTSLSKTHLDASTDDPSQARAELEAVIDRINTKLASVTLIQSTDLSNNGSSGTVAETTGGGFPNVNADVTATDEDIEALQGHSSTLDTILDGYGAERVTLDNDFSAGELVCERIGNTVTVSIRNILHSSGSGASSTATLSASFRPSDNLEFSGPVRSSNISAISINANGVLSIEYFAWDGSAATDTAIPDTAISYVIEGNIS